MSKISATVFWALMIAASMIVEVSAFGTPKSQVKFSVNDTNVMLLVKSSVLSHAGRRSDGERVALFWSGRVEENGTVILHEPSSSHPYAVILQGPPESRPELGVEFEGRESGRNTIRVQPTIPKNGTIEIRLWFMIHNDLAFILPDRSSHWLPPPRPESPRVQPKGGKEKGLFVLLWTQPQLLGMSNAVSFDVRWSTGTVSKARWEDEKRIPDMDFLQQVADDCWMDVSSFVSAGARSFSIRAIDSQGHDSPVSEPALVDSDGDNIPDVWEIECFGDLSKDATWDTDKDHVPDFVEFRLGLDPNNPDSDGDGLPDGFEMNNINGFNPKKPDSDIDSDGDGASNLEEYKAGTDIWDSSSRPGVKGPRRQ